MASTCRSNQSLTAWLLAQTSGPASSTPVTIKNQRPSGDTPEAITPQQKAHIGGNQVIGFNNSATTGQAGTDDGTGRVRDDMTKILRLTLASVNLNLHLLRLSTIVKTLAMQYPEGHTTDEVRHFR